MELVDREECRRVRNPCIVLYFTVAPLPCASKRPSIKRYCLAVLPNVPARLLCILNTNKHMHITTAPTPEARLVRTDVEYGII